MTDDILLNDLWTVYFHDPSDTDWTNKSYIRIGDIASVDDYWTHARSWGTQIYQGMFFVMRDGIFPCWDDANNIDGGCLSIKVTKENMYEFWPNTFMKLIGETLLKDPYKNNQWKLINGISMSPKKHFCILKIWIKTPELVHEQFDIIPKYHGDIIYKSNRDNIESDNMRRL